MRIEKLKNGVHIVWVKTASPTVTVQVNISMGGGVENANEAGYAHFLEHMLFEGTKTRSNFALANEVESVGGEMNGSTNNERTRYYIKMPASSAQGAVNVLADMVCNPRFDKTMFTKEKQVILSEIDMYHDDPKLYQWLLFEEAVFPGKLGKSTLGSRKSIANASLPRLKAFYNKHYKAGNITVVIAGAYPKLNTSVFNQLPKGNTKQTYVLTPPKRKTIQKKMKNTQSYTMLGFRTPSRKDRESIVLDVVYGHLGRGASGKLFDELRNKRGVGYAVHTIHEPGKYAGMFAVAVSTKKKHLSMVKKIITEQINKTKTLSPKELREAKQYVLGSLTMQKEDSKNVAERVSYWLFAASSASYNKYLADLRRVTAKEVATVIGKYCVNPVHIILQESS